MLTDINKRIPRRLQGHLRIRFPRAIGADNGGEVGISKEEDMVAFVGFEIYQSISATHHYLLGAC